MITLFESLDKQLSSFSSFLKISLNVSVCQLYKMNTFISGHKNFWNNSSF